MMYHQTKLQKTGTIPINIDTEVRPPNHYCRGKAKSITYSACLFVALVIQYTTRMRRIKFSPLTCLTEAYFSTLSRKRYDFRKYVMKHKIFFNFLCNFCQKRFTL
jgi:hypothetical protein